MSRLRKKLEETDLDIEDLYDYDDDSIEDKILTPAEEKRRKMQHVAAAVAMILVVAIIVSAIAISPDSDDDKTVNPNKTVDNQQTEQTSVQVTEASDNALDSERYPEITELVELYYQAKLTGDTSAIEKYVDNIEDVNMEEIKASNEYIKKYNNIECYTKAGLEDNTYVVFARYDIKFKNIETLAPGIDIFYVIRDEETGYVFIHNGATANADIKTYVEALEQDADVIALYEEVNAAFQEALNSDASLNEFYNALTKGSGNTQGN